MAEAAPCRHPTPDEVAEHAGVSRSAASRALNDAPMLVALVNGQDPTPLVLPTRLAVRAGA